MDPMMAKISPVIRFEFEPLVKLTCLNVDCIHNLAHNALDPEAACNLKTLSINEDGKCMNMVVKDKKKDVSE
jgi:hypothetical protein